MRNINIKLNIKHIVIGATIAPLAIAHPMKAQQPESFFPSTDSCLGCSVTNLGSEVKGIENSQFNSGGRSPDIMEVAHEDHREDQIEILEQALELANSLENLSERLGLFSEIAIKYANIGDRDRALDILFMAQELANTIEDPQQRSILLSQIALKEAELQPRDIAAERLTAAREIANTIEDPQQRIRLLSQIALKLAELGETEQAAEILSQTEDILTQVPEPPQLFPFEPIPWTGRAGLSSNFFSRKKTTSLVSFSFGLERKWPTDEFDLTLDLTNDFDDSRVAPQEDNQFKGSLNTEYRHHYSDLWQYFINSGVRRDELDNINVRSNLYTGSGINLWRASDSRTLDMQLGLGVRFEDSNRRSNDFDAPVAQYRLRYKDIFFDSLRLRQFLTFELPLDDMADYYIESSTNLAIPITGGWSFSNFLNLEYAGQPTLGNPNFEVNLQTGLEYQF